MNYRSGTGAGKTLHVHSPGGSTFLHEMTSLPVSLMSNQKSDSVSPRVFTWRTFLPNLIPIRSLRLFCCPCTGQTLHANLAGRQTFSA